MLDYGKDGNKYRYTGEYPSREAYKVYYFYKQGICVFTYGYVNSKDIDPVDTVSALLTEAKVSVPWNGVLDANAIRMLSKYYTCETHIHPDYEIAVRTFKEKSEALLNQWYTDIYEEYSVDPEDPVVQLIMSKAWERGHSSGLQEVDHHVGEYFDFVTSIANVAHKSELFKQQQYF